MGFGKASICLGFWLVAAMTVWPASSVRGQTGSESSVGYIDSAIPRTQLRLRVDAAYNDNRADRVEFFYAKYGFLGGPGPPLAEKRVDYQEIDPGLEYALSDRFSIFADFPTLLTNPLFNVNSEGFSDMDAGFKYALLACDDRFLTFPILRRVRRLPLSHQFSRARGQASRRARVDGQEPRDARTLHRRQPAGAARRA